MEAEFDSKAATWDDDPLRVKRAEEIASAMQEQIDFSAVKTALEYGSGTGLLSFALESQLTNVVLMDESEEMTRVAKAKCEKLKVDKFKPIKYNLIQDPLPKDRFDLIYILLTLHHVLHYEDLLLKFSKLLNPGGKLAIIDLEKEDGSFHDGDFHGHKGFDLCMLKGKVEETGLSVTSSDICYEIEKTDENGHTRKYPLFLMISQIPG